MVTYSKCERFCAACRVFVAVVGVSLLVTPAASGQTNAQASITGVLTDQSGAVLPGVTVTASSPSLQVRQVSTVG